jgi:D-3-phosphoglycerate dehydrogenase
MKILISDAFDPALPEKLARFGEVFDDKDRVAEADVVLVRSKTKCTKEYIDGATNLKLIIRGGVGIDNIDSEYARQKGVAVHNTASASSIAVAEIAMALLLAIPANVIPGHNSMKGRDWQKKALKRTELYKKTIGFLGIGRIATETARRAAAFGMKVIAFDKYVDESDVAEMVTFEELIERSDFISLHLPLTPETDGMINADTIGRMKDGVILVNTGRGKCVNEADMAAALTSGKVRAYGTDVWYSDPPNWDECPLIDAPNCYMTPHIGASTKENLLRIGDVIEEIIDEYVKEGKL